MLNLDLFNLLFPLQKVQWRVSCGQEECERDYEGLQQSMKRLWDLGNGGGGAEAEEPVLSGRHVGKASERPRLPFTVKCVGWKMVAIRPGYCGRVMAGLTATTERQKRRMCNGSLGWLKIKI